VIADITVDRDVCTKVLLVVDVVQLHRRDACTARLRA